MTKSLKNVKNGKCTVKDLEYGEKPENHGNEKNTLEDVKYGKKTENHGK